MIEIKQLSYDELTKEQQDGASNNGCGKECATYLQMNLDGDVFTESDAMEPEDVRFYRDLSWVQSWLEKAYLAGVKEGRRLEKGAKA